MSFSPEEWQALFDKQRADAREIFDYLTATAVGVPEPWRGETNPFDEILPRLAGLFSQASIKSNIGDYRLAFAEDVVSARHYLGVESFQFGISPMEWVRTSVNGYTVTVTANNLELATPLAIASPWRRIIWSSGLLEPHHKGDLVYVEGCGTQTWNDPNSGKELVEDQPIYYYPTDYPGYPPNPKRVCRGNPIDRVTFPDSITGMVVLPKTSIELSVNYDQWVKRVIDQSGILTLLSQTAPLLVN